MSQQSKHLDSRGRLPQITGEVARDSAEMLDGLGFRSLSDFLTAASWAYRRGLFQGTFYPMAMQSNPTVVTTEPQPEPKPEIEYTPMVIEDGFDFEDDDDE